MSLSFLYIGSAGILLTRVLKLELVLSRFQKPTTLNSPSHLRLKF